MDESRTAAATEEPDRLAWSLPGRPCSVAAGLALVGDKWSLLVVRELLFGNHRFDQIARNTGAPRDRLAARLTELNEAGIIERALYNEHPPRYEYHLTTAGRELLPVIHALRSWGDKWAIDQPPAVFRHTCGHEMELVQVCRSCGEELKPRSLTPEIRSPGWDLRGPTPVAPASA